MAADETTGQAVVASEAEQAAAAEAASLAVRQLAVSNQANVVTSAESAVASQADAVAKGELAVSSEAAAASTGVLSGSLNALKATLLANPLTAILVLIAAVVVAVANFNKETKEESFVDYVVTKDECNRADTTIAT